MFAYMEGHLLEQEVGQILLKVNHIAYEISVPYWLDCQVGEECSLYLHTYVRENQITLYGFQTREHKRFFELLLEVSGIGPKLALNILGQTDLIDFVQWVNQNDLTALTKMKGLGKKGAERLVLELKDKVKTLYQDQRTPKVDKTKNVASEQQNEMIQTLMMLGYSAKEAELYAQAYDPEKTIEENLKLCFKKIAENKLKG